MSTERIAASVARMLRLLSTRGANRSSHCCAHSFLMISQGAFSLGSKLDRVERHIDRVMPQHCSAKLTPITFAGCFVGAVQALLCSSNLLCNSSMYVDPESLAESAHTRSVVPRDPYGVADVRHLDTVKALHRFPWCRPSRRFPTL
ncbi:hypothetical protein BGLA2_700102 [Burkholderia gladioli]|nr:hypothetical protein BGLA2_700102 [Burkholderia gladioli]